MVDIHKHIANLSPEKRALLELRLMQKGLAGAKSEPIPRRKSSESCILSFAQQRLWFLDQLEPGRSLYNIFSAFRLSGPLNVAALEKSIDEIIRRHESLRTTFAAVDGQPIQVIAKSSPFKLPLVNLSGLPETDRESEIHRLASEEALRPFNLAQGPLFKVALLKVDEDDHVLLLTMHHIISDGWSMGVFYHELTTLYEAYAAGKPSSLPELPIQYADFAVWQRQWLQGEVLEGQLNYWRRQLDGAQPMLELPTDRLRPAVQTYRGSKEGFTLPKPLIEGLKALSAKEGTTLYMTLMAAFQTLLCRYAGQEDIIVGSPIANRNRTEIEELIGFFVNTLVIRVDLTGGPSFRELLQRVRNVSLEAYAHQDLPFEKLVEELQPERDMSRSPLVQVVFAFQNAPRRSLEISGLTVQPLKQKNDTAKFDLTLFLWEIEDALEGSIEYRTDLFDGTTITRMVGHFQRLLESIIANPDQSISKLSLLTARERHQLLVEWNDTRTDYPKDRCIHELFEEQVERSPDEVALFFNDQEMTYRELNERANQLAHYLRTLGVEPEVPVGICVERSLEMVVGLLGILKAGGVYVPLDTTYPKERITFIIKDTKTRILLTQEHLLEYLPDFVNCVVRLDSDWKCISQKTRKRQYGGITAENLAYIMYTSGSTGRPKGVSVSHQNVARLVNKPNYVSLTNKENLLLFAPFTFDASTFEIWGSLLNGARLVIFPAHVPSLEELGEALQRYRITTLWLSAGLFHKMVENNLESLKTIRQLLAGGDVLSATLFKKALQQLGSSQIINGYGPTENTTFTCCHRMNKPSQVGMSVPIGRPISNTQVYILDHHLQPIPAGILGEIYIGGEGLARGYLNRPELTAEKFIPNPFSPEPGTRLYKTGDMARYLPDGTIEFIGRIDYQVKIRGFRVEPGEVEAFLIQHPAVREALVLAREDKPNDRRLVAYVVAVHKHKQPTISELRRFLKKKLPEFMIPSTFVFLDNLPLTLSGKINRRSLPAPDQTRPELESMFVPPRTSVEKKIAEIWSELLRIENVGLMDNFFELGGHSLLATQVISRINDTFQLELSLRFLFEDPTISGLIPHIEQSRDNGKAAQKQSIKPLSREFSKVNVSPKGILTIDNNLKKEMK